MAANWPKPSSGPLLARPQEEGSAFFSQAQGLGPKGQFFICLFCFGVWFFFQVERTVGKGGCLQYPGYMVLLYMLIGFIDVTLDSSCPVSGPKIH